MKAIFQVYNYLIMFPTISSVHFPLHSIGSKEACALAESLKQNTILTNLNFSYMSELCEVLCLAT